MSICLLEVVTHDLFLHGDPGGGHEIEPIREGLVQLGPTLLRYRPVRGVSDQEVAEREGLAHGKVGAPGRHEPLSDERGDPGVDIVG